jgi:hypothetical protein
LPVLVVAAAARRISGGSGGGRCGGGVCCNVAVILDLVHRLARILLIDINWRCWFGLGLGLGLGLGRAFGCFLCCCALL